MKTNAELGTKVWSTGRACLLLLGVVAAAVAGGRFALAKDAKVYPGSLCVPGAAWNLSHSRDHGSGSLTVINNQKEIWCPIVGDEATSLGIKTTVYLFESAATASGDAANTVCTTYAYSALSGVPVDSTSATAVSGMQALPMTVTAHLATAPARYAIKCILTASSTLYGYQAEEQ